MKINSFLIIALVLGMFLLSGCFGQLVSPPESTIEKNFTETEVKSDTIPVVIKIENNITEETLNALKEQGLEIENFEESSTYGNVVFGKIKKDEIGRLQNIGNISKGVTEDEYKTEVLKEIAIEVHPILTKESRELGFLVQDQIGLDKQREEAGIEIGPLIELKLIDKLDQSEFVPVVIMFRIEAWENWEEYSNKISSKLGKDIQIESSNWRGIIGYITKEGLEKLKDEDYIILISSRNVKIRQG